VTPETTAIVLGGGGGTPALVDTVDWLVRAGILSAVAVWFGRWYAAWQERNAEREGLLRLLDLELARHEPILKSYASDDRFGKTGAGIQNVQFLKTDTWEQTRVRLARLLTSEEFTRLAHYYRNAQDMNDLLTPDYSLLQRRRAGPGLRNAMVGEGPEVRRWIQEKLPKDYQPPQTTFPE
jgi:hypothetical protein